jgi:hypothetical protein
LENQRSASTEVIRANVGKTSDGSLEREAALIEERVERAPRNLYGGKTLEKNGKGFTRKIFIPVCDDCGLRIGTDDLLKSCTETDCKAKICENCSIAYQGRTYCRSCLKSKVGIDEYDLNVLNLIILFGRIAIPDIGRQLQTSSRSIRKSLQKLLEANLIQRSSISIFTRFEPTPVATYNQQSIARLFTLPEVRSSES